MREWIDMTGAFLANHWPIILLGMLGLYYVYHYLMLFVSIAVFPLVAAGSGIWDLRRFMKWPNDEDNRLSPRNFFFFLAGSLAFLIEIWLFAIFLEYYLLGESVLPIYKNLGVRMSVVSGIGFGMLTLIFGHLAHHLLSRSPDSDPAGGEAAPPERPTLSADRLVGWAAAFFFLIATLVLGYSGGLRAHTLATAIDANATVKSFSILIGSVFGFMMPFGAVVGMSRGGFLWHLVINMLIGIPLVFGLLFLLIAAFLFFLIDILLNLITLPISKLFAVIAGFSGLRLEDSESERELRGWRLGLHRLMSSAEPPERLRNFLAYVRTRVSTFLEEDPPPKAPRKGAAVATSAESTRPTEP